MAHCPHTYLKCPECNKADQIMLEALKEIVKEGLDLRKGALALVIIAQAAINAAEGKVE